MNIHQIPFLRLLLPYIAGVIIAWYTLSYTIAIFISVFALCLFITDRLYFRGKGYNMRHICGIYITLLFTAIGIISYNMTLPYEFHEHRCVTSYEIYQYNKAHNTPTALEAKALEVRESLINIYREHTSSDNVGIISAITLGKKDGLDRDTKKQFSMSGGSHVLAVSGLHVGIIYMIMLWLTSLLPRRRTINILSHIITILCLWAYAFICGLPASVVRSALMFSLISVAVIIERRNVSLNAVFTSAFIMLMYKPLYLFDVGFQLSYAAVISILLFYPKIYSLLTLKSRLLNIAWSMICVSAAAQIGTLPLTVYYFHQIPTYSLLTNFLVVPAAFLIIYTSAIMLIVSPLQTIAGFAGLAADTVTTYLRTGVEYIVNLPYSVIDGLRVSGWMVIGMFAAILTFYAFTESRKARDLMASLSIVAILQLIDILIQIKVVTLPI